MQPVNSSERRKATINFMLLFLLCTGIIVTTVFYSTIIPLRQNNKLIKEKNDFLKKEEVKNEFTNRFINISKMIDSLGLKNQAEVKTYSISIDNEIAELNKLIITVTDDNSKLYTNVIKNLNLYHEAKKSEKKEVATDEKDQLYKDKIAQLEDRAAALYKSLNECLDRENKKKP